MGYWQDIMRYFAKFLSHKRNLWRTITLLIFNMFRDLRLCMNDHIEHLQTQNAIELSSAQKLAAQKLG